MNDEQKRIKACVAYLLMCGSTFTITDWRKMREDIGVPTSDIELHGLIHASHPDGLIRRTYYVTEKGKDLLR